MLSNYNVKKFFNVLGRGNTFQYIDTAINATVINPKIIISLLKKSNSALRAYLSFVRINSTNFKIRIETSGMVNNV